MSGDIWSAIGGAALGFIAGVAVEWWKSERQDLMDVCREFCTIVEGAADAGAEFRLTAPTAANAQFLFARVAGFQERIAAYNTILVGRLDAESSDDINNQLAKLFKGLTGGDADDSSREVSMEKALIIHDQASAAIVAIRRASFERISFRQTILRKVRNSWPNSRTTMKPPPPNPFQG